MICIKQDYVSIINQTIQSQKILKKKYYLLLKFNPNDNKIEFLSISA